MTNIFQQPVIPQGFNNGLPFAANYGVNNSADIGSMAYMGLPGGDYASIGSYGAPNVSGQQDFGLNPAQMQNNLGSIFGGLSGLGQIWGMLQSLGLQRKAFKFSQEGTKRNFNAAATAFNNAEADRDTARKAYAAINGGGYNSLASYGGGQRTVDKWT